MHALKKSNSVHTVTKKPSGIKKNSLSWTSAYYVLAWRDANPHRFCADNIQAFRWDSAKLLESNGEGKTEGRRVSCGTGILTLFPAQPADGLGLLEPRPFALADKIGMLL